MIQSYVYVYTVNYLCIINNRLDWTIQVQKRCTAMSSFYTITYIYAVYIHLVISCTHYLLNIFKCILST